MRQGHHLAAVRLALAGIGWILVCAPSSGAGLQQAEAREISSPGTLSIAIEIDRDATRALSVVAHPHPFRSRTDPPIPRALDRDRPAQLEIVVSDPQGRRHTRRVEIRGLCLEHGADEPAHIDGDTIQLHRESLVIDLPDLDGFNDVEIAYYEKHRGALQRRKVGRHDLSRLRQSPTEPEKAGTSNNVIWPEMLDDPDIVEVYGSPLEGPDRINVIIVPDGYTYAEKALMQDHAASMVEHFNTNSPLAELKNLFNYTLVYAYSSESGADQCDCGIVQNTAMGTRFPQSQPACGHDSNRCLFYATGCDSSGGAANIAAAEQRAPHRDKTIVMVNTTRYGGCAGSRAVFSAAHASGNELALHEISHVVADLYDEYGGNEGCGTFAGEVNVSRDGIDGAWPEWIAELGPPREGGRFYDSCLYRPLDDCKMRSLFQPFCPVCLQRWALKAYGHPRIAGKAPIAGQTPGSPVPARTEEPATYSVNTRLPAGPEVTNSITWTVEGPEPGNVTVVANDVEAVDLAFDAPGLYTLRAEVIAATNLIKPERAGANVAIAEWEVRVTDPFCGDRDDDGFGRCFDCDDTSASVWSTPGAAAILFDFPGFIDWQIEEPGATSAELTFRVLRAVSPDGFSDATCLGSSSTSFLPIPAVPPPGDLHHFLVIADNPCGTGLSGTDSSGTPRAVTDCP